MQPDIYIGNLRLAEAGIALTGLFIAAVCGYAWWRLQKRQMLSTPQRWMLRFFALMTISSIIGPLFSHLFYYRVGFPGKYACWFFTILSLGALAQAVIEHAKPVISNWGYRLLVYLNISALIAALIISGLKQQFLWVEVHSALALLGFLAPLEGLVFSKKHDPGSRLLLWSLPLAVLAVLPHVFKWSINTWITYFDIGHIILLSSLWFMLLGTEKVKDYTSSTA